MRDKQHQNPHAIAFAHPQNPPARPLACRAKVIPDSRFSALDFTSVR
jgi:hypothetical protein